MTEIALSLPLAVELTSVFIVAGVVVAGIVGTIFTTVYHRIKRREAEASAPKPHIASAAAPVPVEQEVRAIGKQIEKAMADQRLEGETQRQLLTQKLDSVRQAVDAQRTQFDGLRSEIRHEFRRRDTEISDIKYQIAEIRSATALPEAPLASPPMLPPASDADGDEDLHPAPLADAPGEHDADAVQDATFSDLEPEGEQAQAESAAPELVDIPLGAAPTTPPLTITVDEPDTADAASDGEDDTFMELSLDAFFDPADEEAEPTESEEALAEGASLEAEPVAPDEETEPTAVSVPSASSDAEGPTETDAAEDVEAEADDVRDEAEGEAPASSDAPEAPAWIARPDRTAPAEAPEAEAASGSRYNFPIAMPVVAPMDDFFTPSKPKSTAAPAPIAPAPVPESVVLATDEPEDAADPALDTDNADDLTVISTVDPEMQQRLYEAGVLTLDTIARWSRADARRVGARLDVPEDTIINGWIFEAQAALFNQFAQKASR